MRLPILVSNLIVVFILTGGLCQADAAGER